MRAQSSRFRPKGPEGREAVRSLFSKFRRVLDLNTRVLVIMNEMEQALGGEYIFDKAYLVKTVHEVTSLARQVIYSLNALAEYRYLKLFDRFESIRSALLDILEGKPGPDAGSLVLSLDRIHWEALPLVGKHGVCLAELRRQDALVSKRPLDGFAVTALGSRLLADTTAPAPKKLETTLDQELEALFDRLGGEARLRLTASVFDPEDYSGLQAPENQTWLRDVEAKSFVGALRRVLENAGEQSSAKAGENAGTAVFVIAQNPDPEAAGLECRVRTFVREGLMEAMEILAGKADSSDAPSWTDAERWLLSRIPPYTPLESTIAPITGKAALSGEGQGNLRRGSSLLSRSRLGELANLAMALEHAVGAPVTMAATADDKGGLAPRNASPLPDTRRQEPDEQDLLRLEEELRTAEVLLHGGETAQLGVAAGRVIHVSQDTDPWIFPLGAVAVSPQAGPGLSPILQRAAALVTEKGGASSHLATIAREHRVPTIMGAEKALSLLPEGTEVTVDAGEHTVYAGVLEELLHGHDVGNEEFYPTDPEYIQLRQLLRLITPLHLLDPESPDFTPQGCRSIHDMIHFSHERAVEELLHLRQRRGGKGMRHLETRRLLLDAPLDLWVMDVESAVVPNAGSDLRPKDVDCAPLRAFLRGLELKEMWSSEPAALKLRHIFSAMDKSVGLMMGGSPYAGQSLAIVGEEYVNLSLRLGYHFSVVDALLSGDANNNYVYFRFVGGLADTAARRRRAELIRAVLESMNFRVTQQDDLVVGKLKVGEARAMAHALTRIGELTGFTRQLDVNMASDADVESFAALFLKRIRDGQSDDTGSGS